MACASGTSRPAAKSSTLPHSTEIALYDAGMPVLTPGTSQEVLDLGRHGYELSRFSGVARVTSASISGLTCHSPGPVSRFTDFSATTKYG